MLFIIVLIPMGLLTAFLAWRCWRVNSPRVALAMAGTCIGCMVTAALLIYGMIYLYQALKITEGG